MFSGYIKEDCRENNRNIEFQNDEVDINEISNKDEKKNLDWIFNVENQFIKRIIIGNKIICEIPHENWENAVKIVKNKVYLYTGYKEWLSLHDREPFLIEIGSVKKRVWIGEICYFEDILEQTCLQNIITDEGIEFFKSIDKPVEKKKIIYGRCKRSMCLLDDIHRLYINNRKFKANDIIAIKSVAGSGKTTTLLNLARKFSKKKILYLAFNKSLITEIKDKIKKENINNLLPHTFDALLYKLFISIKGYNPDITTIKPQNIGNIVEWFNGKPFRIKNYYCQYFIKFCNDIDEHDMSAFCIKNFGKKKPLLEELWNKINEDNIITFEIIRKQAFLNNWFKGYIDEHFDMIMIDETQDFDMIMLKMLLNDTTIPKIFVGDPKQSIYEFRGCINAFEHLPKESLIVEFYSTFRIGNPACDEIRNKFESCWMISKSTSNETIFVDSFDDTDKYTYLFRTWKVLLQTAEKMPGIWIYGYEKKISEIRNLHAKLVTIKNFDMKTNILDDDLPMFLKSLSAEELEKIIENVSNNIVNYDESQYKLYTVHSYKGMEDHNIRIAEDIDVQKEENIYYVAITRAMKKIMIDKKTIISKESNSSISSNSNNIFLTNNVTKDNAKKTTKKDPSDKITFNLFLEGKTIEEIVIIRKISIATVENHIISNLPSKQYDINTLISKNEYDEIDNELKKYNYDTLLKPIKENISNKISYFKIKIIKKVNGNKVI